MLRLRPGTSLLFTPPVAADLRRSNDHASGASRAVVALPFGAGLPASGGGGAAQTHAFPQELRSRRFAPNTHTTRLASRTSNARVVVESESAVTE
jgi:hypothetical protein